MKRILFILFIFCTTTSLAQVDLTVMTKAERDSALVTITQDLLLKKFPKWYRKEICPVIYQGRFTNLDWEWAEKDESWSLRKLWKISDDITPEDTWYCVTLYYEHWKEEGVDWDYTASAHVIGKTGEIFKIFLGSGFGHYAPPKRT